MCCTVRNAKESHNEFHQVVPVAHVPDSATHACGLCNLAETCNGIVLPYLWSIGACTSLCNWHQCFDLTEIVVALFCISNSAAHICGLRYFTCLCSNQVRPDIQSIGACTSMHDQYRLLSLLQIPLDGRPQSLLSASWDFFKKWHTDKVFWICCKCALRYRTLCSTTSNIPSTMSHLSLLVYNYLWFAPLVFSVPVIVYCRQIGWCHAQVWLVCMGHHILKMPW